MFDRKFQLHGLDIIDSQEGMVPTIGVSHTDAYTMYRAAADDSGNFGTQFWLRKHLAKNCIANQEISTRCLRVSLSMAWYKVHMIAAHAPINPAATEQKDEFFWTHSMANSNLLSVDMAAVEDMLFLLIDTNGCVASVKNPAVGNTAREVEDDNGIILRNLLETYSLKAVNTYLGGEQTREGPTRRQSRIDYVCTWSRTLSKVEKCWVPVSLDLVASIRRDHFAVCATVPLPDQTNRAHKHVHIVKWHSFATLAARNFNIHDSASIANFRCCALRDRCWEHPGQQTCKLD